MHWVETELLTREENLIGLMAFNRQTLARAESSDEPDRVVLDMDSSESPVHGQQEGSAYNGHFESTCYHPLFLFNSHGDCLAAKLRPGNVHGAEDWDELLLPEIDLQQEKGKEIAFRADAAFAKPEVYEILEKHGVQYAIRVPANQSLEWEIADILYSSAWSPQPQAACALQELPLSGEKLVEAAANRRQGGASSGRVVPAGWYHCHQHDLAQPLGSAVPQQARYRSAVDQGRQAGNTLDAALLSSCSANEVRLQLSVLAYNRRNLWRRLRMPRRITNWSLTSLQRRLMKTGGRLL